MADPILGLRLIIDDSWHGFHCPTCGGLYYWRPDYYDLFHQCADPKPPLGWS